jgi:phage protein D
VNKTPLTGVVSIEVINTSHFSADTFRVVTAISDLPVAMNAQYWDHSVGDEIEIFISVNGETPQSVIYGQIDDVEYERFNRTLQLSGRDLSARLLDTRITEVFTDQTASKIVQTVAASHGLNANVQATSNRAGSFIEVLNAKLNQTASDWELLVTLAQQEGFDLWVTGHTINFQPPVLKTTDPYVLLWSDYGQGNRVSNMKELVLRRSETLARDVVVKVYSWNQSQGKVFASTPRRRQVNKTGTQLAQTVQTFSFYPANLTQQQVNQYANSMVEEITKHERTLIARMPGDNLLTTRIPVKLAGTGTDWDQIYYPDTIIRNLSLSNGYTMELRAKNHSAVIPSAS